MNEILKLRTTRTPWVLLLVTQLVLILGISGLFVSGADPADPLTALQAVAHAGLASIFSLVLGIIAVAGEYRHKTITDTYLSTPRRSRVVAGKLAVYAAVGAVYGLVSTISAIAVTAAWLSAKGYSLDLGDADLWGTAAGCIVWNACFTAIGVGVGALLRNLFVAVAAALAWVALVEGLVGQLLGGLARWLPMRSGQALEGVPFPGIDLLPQWGGAIVLAGYAAAFAVVAVSTTVRRDVT